MALTHDILTAFENDLLNIKSLYGYNNTMVKAHKIYKNLSDVKEPDFDSFCVQGDFAKAEYYDSCIHWEWAIAVYFYLNVPNSDTEELMGVKIENLKSDIVRLLTTQLTVQVIGAVESIQLLGFQPFLENKKAVFLAMFQISFNE